MEYIEMAQDPIVVVGIAQRVKNPKLAAIRIESVWADFLQQNYLEEIPTAIENAIYAIYTDYDDEGQFTFILGAAIEDPSFAPEGLVIHEIPAGDYALYQINGPMPETVQEHWQQFNVSDLEFERAYDTDFEKWDINEMYEMPEQVEIYISKL